MSTIYVFFKQHSFETTPHKKNFEAREKQNTKTGSVYMPNPTATKHEKTTKNTQSTQKKQANTYLNKQSLGFQNSSSTIYVQNIITENNIDIYDKHLQLK
jgi:hypothetical protein